MKTISSQDYYIPYEQMISLRENGTEHQIKAIAEEIEKLDSSNRFKELEEISSKEVESYLKKLKEL